MNHLFITTAYSETGTFFLWNKNQNSNKIRLEGAAMHIFLTGEPHIGKSTIIQKVLAELRILPGGFLTFSGNDAQDGSSDVYIQAAGAKETELSPANRIGCRYGNGVYQSFPEIFDTLGVTLLSQTGFPLILMDELGFMENKACLFQNKVLSVLDQKIPVLGVIKRKPLPFLDSVRNHPQVSLLEITKQNRDEQLYHVLSLLHICS